MKVKFVSLFPEMVLGAARHSILQRAEEAGLVAFHAVNPRDFATDLHRTVDDHPFGGDPGMVLRCQEMDLALRSLDLHKGDPVVFFEPWGTRFEQSHAREFSRASSLTLVCGRYEGIDHRMHEKWATHVLSLGDFVLTGGELPALIVADAVTRLIPGVLGSGESLEADSHADGLLSYPQYTRPQNFEGMEVPEVLTSGNHGAIQKWRREQQIKFTRKHRPDLFAKAPLDPADLELL